MAAKEDIVLAERLIGVVAAGLREDGMEEDAGSLLAIGRLGIRLDALRALIAGKADEEADVFARGLLLDIRRTFPTRVDWMPLRSDELLHRRHATIGRAVLTGERAL